MHSKNTNGLLRSAQIFAAGASCEDGRRPHERQEVFLLWW